MGRVQKKKWRAINPKGCEKNDVGLNFCFHLGHRRDKQAYALWDVCIQGQVAPGHKRQLA